MDTVYYTGEALLVIKIPSQKGGPVADVEDHKDDGQRDLADELKLLSLSFSPRPEKDCHDDELEDATEDEEHADEHPDVQEGDVGNTRNILPD